MYDYMGTVHLLVWLMTGKSVKKLGLCQKRLLNYINTMEMTTSRVPALCR